MFMQSTFSGNTGFLVFIPLIYESIREKSSKRTGFKKQRRAEEQEFSAHEECHNNVRQGA